MQTQKKEPPNQELVSFYDRVYELVRQVPFGKVTTYGAIAKALGAASSSRIVGYALKCAPMESVPCHRVVNRFGALTGKMHFGDPNLMRKLLEREGISFSEDGYVKLDEHFFDVANLFKQ
ncbi:methylated-DNA/protein-cysteine methyltransferase [Chloroherpeton thalassium ATCC 35110]|uniref:Methylated-DNA/protein-cysteine methyltransferase n=1 Tax=Chloroherpeton thalassium (strain ATCC 35110 / GB-78) TaxID=517418 RepID=B3QW88_CHLT3|nr:MGMT family protein [Chloroherpeton thalassium]ACF13201.1 methylated-DNA/protein-cysteine methyltransferase [Chloroherpeton thalassium ATCC 35110]